MRRFHLVPMLFMKREINSSSLEMTVRVVAPWNTFHSATNVPAPSEKRPRKTHRSMFGHAPTKYVTGLPSYVVRCRVPQALNMCEASSRNVFLRISTEILFTYVVGALQSVPKGMWPATRQ